MKTIFLLLLMSGCALMKSGPDLSETSKETPSWVYAPYGSCNETSELCATGEANSFSGADAEARKNLASIFEVKINSEFTAVTSYSKSAAWRTSVQEDIHKSLQESVNQILEGVEIKQRHRSKGLSYSLASLDRAKASELIAIRLSKIDDELNVLWKQRDRTSFRRIARLFLEREKLNERYFLVSGNPRPALMSYKDILAWKQSRLNNAPLALRIGQAPEWMVEKVKELLTEAGFRLVKGDASKAVSLNVDSIKEYLNVSGFEKYTFTLNMTSFEGGEKNRVITASETVTGRSQADALLKVKSFFNDYIEQHLSELQLD